MGRKKKEKVDISSLDELKHNPFAALGQKFGISPSEDKADPAPGHSKANPPAQPMLLVRKEKRKAGKIMTCIYHVQGDRKALLKKMKQRFGTGGTVDEEVVALQGDLREKAAEWLQEQGFKVRLGN